MVSGDVCLKNAYAICTLIKKKVQVFSLDHRYQGMISRLYEPAVVIYSQNGKSEVISKTYYINNERFKDEFLHAVKSAEIEKRDH